VIDRKGREATATAVHELLGKYVSFEDFYYSYPARSIDDAVNAVRSGIFFAPTDGEGGVDFDRNSRKAVLRSVLFLRSDLEYEWSRFSMGCGSCLLSLLSCGLYIPLWHWLHREEIKIANAQDAAGDVSVWPFYRKSDFDAEYAKSCPFARAKAA
jgi:hypothetical protein